MSANRRLRCAGRGAEQAAGDAEAVRIADREGVEGLRACVGSLTRSAGAMSSTTTWRTRMSCLTP